MCSLFKLKCCSLILTLFIYRYKSKEQALFDVPSAIKPLPHGSGIPIPNSSRDFFKFESLSSTDNDDCANDLWDQPTRDEPNYKQPNFLTQPQLNDLTTDLYLSKESAQRLGS